MLPDPEDDAVEELEQLTEPLEKAVAATEEPIIGTVTTAADPEAQPAATAAVPTVTGGRAVVMPSGYRVTCQCGFRFAAPGLGQYKCGHCHDVVTLA